MDSIDQATSLESLNGVQKLGSIVAGGCSTIDLSNRELGVRELAVGISRLLPRSAFTLISLDLR
jgi:hypothetical protein